VRAVTVTAGDKGRRSWGAVRPLPRCSTLDGAAKGSAVPLGPRYGGTAGAGSAALGPGRGEEGAGASAAEPCCGGDEWLKEDGHRIVVVP